MSRHIIPCFLWMLLCGMGCQPCTAQQFFNKRYTVGSRQLKFTSGTDRGDKYYTAGVCLDSINHIKDDLFLFKNGIKFSIFDLDGSLIASKLFQRADKIFTNTSMSNNLYSTDSGFLIAVSVIDTALDIVNPSYRSAQASLIHFDTLGNVLWVKDYARPYCTITDPTNHILMDFKPDLYGNWLMLSSLVCSGKVVFCLRKLDSSYNEIWVKNFSTNTYHNAPKHLLIEEDGYVMSGGVDNSNIKMFPDYYTSVLIKCDTAGNTLWDWHNAFDTAHIQYTINGIIRSKDGGYVYCGSGEGRPSYYDGKKDWADISVWGWVEKLDAARNSVWKTKIGYLLSSVDRNSQNVIKELPDGDLIVAGSLGRYFNDVAPYGNVKGALTKLRGSDGTVIWQRTYDFHPDTLSCYVYDMRETADGGYLLAGECKDDAFYPFDAPTQRGWLVKVDSNGCEGPDDPQCWPLSVAAPGVQDVFTVYPNPSESLFELSYSRQLRSAALLVSDVLGRLVHQAPLPEHQNHYTIDAGAWPTGLYVYRIISNGSLIHTGKLIKN